jgi:hypothetical protein
VPPTLVAITVNGCHQILVILRSSLTCRTLSSWPAAPLSREADAAVIEITRLCGHLPLAIGMVASQLRQRGAFRRRVRALPNEDAIP